MEDTCLTDPGRSRSPALSQRSGRELFGRLAKKRLPIFKWLPSYTKEKLMGDFVAGTSVALTAVPQTMAYAILAGLSPEYGLYSSFVGPFLYIFLGSCRQVTIGPTAIIALVAFRTCGEDFPECVVLTSFYSGIIELILFLLQLGACVSLISDPVTTGFTAGAALTIAMSQLKSLLGFATATGGNLIGYWTDLFHNLYSGTYSVPDTMLGLSCVFLLTLLQKLNVILGWCLGADHCQRPTLKRTMWVLSVSRNVVVVLSSMILAYIWGNPPFKLTGSVPPGLPALHPPQFLLPNKRNDTSYGETLTFVETLEKLGSGPFVVAFIAILQNVAILKAYGSGQRIDGNQEILALSVIKIVGGFFSAQPTSGSFSRSAVNEASGVKSQFSGFFTGSFIIMALLLLTPLFHFIPKASLGAVVMCALLSMIDYEVILPMFKVSKIDAVICMLTFLTSVLLGMEYGIGLGVAVSLGKILFEFLSARLTSELKTDEETGLKYVVLIPLEGLRFPTVDTLRKSVNYHALEFAQSHPVIVLDCLKWPSLDYTIAAGLVSLYKSLKKNDVHLVLQNVDPKWNRALVNAGLSPGELITAICEDESGLPNLLRKIMSDSSVGAENNPA